MRRVASWPWERELRSKATNPTLQKAFAQMPDPSNIRKDRWVSRAKLTIKPREEATDEGQLNGTILRTVGKSLAIDSADKKHLSNYCVARQTQEPGLLSSQFQPTRKK